MSFTEKDVGKSFLYVIHEVEGEDERVIYDETLRGIELSVADNGDGTLAITQTNVTVTETQDGYEKAAETTELPVFVNHLEPGDISVTKLTDWTEKEPNASQLFDFTLTLVGNEIEVPETIKVRLSTVENLKPYTQGTIPEPDAAAQLPGATAEQDGSYSVTLTDGSYSFKLAAGHVLTVEDLPAGVAYQFQEAIPAGWTLTFDNVAGVVAPQATQAATYTNKFEPGKAVATVLATKRMDGKTPEAQKFAFELVDDTEDSPTKGHVLQTLWNHASGYVLFDLNYETAGTYHYLLREVSGLIDSVDENGNITYVTDEDELRKISFDENSYGVTVVVTEQDNAGSKTLSAKVTYDENDNKPPQFNNATNPGSLQITKVGEGLTDANKDKEFTFKVTLSNDAGMPLTENGQMIWYAKDSDEKSPVAPLPETPDQPENSEPEAAEQPQTAQQQSGPNALPGRNLLAARQ